MCVCLCVCPSVDTLPVAFLRRFSPNCTKTCKPPKVRMSLLGVNIAPPFPYFPPKNLQFWGVNRRFQAKLAKSKNVHIIKTIVSIPTKFCTVVKTTKCPSWVVTTHEGHLVVFTTVQNLVGIDTIVLIICTFFDFASLA